MNMQISSEVARLFEAAQQLSVSDQMQLVGLLAGDLEGPSAPSEAEPLAEVVRRRIAEIESGAVIAQDSEELLDELDRLDEADEE